VAACSNWNASKWITTNSLVALILSQHAKQQRVMSHRGAMNRLKTNVADRKPTNGITACSRELKSYEMLGSSHTGITSSPSPKQHLKTVSPHGRTINLHQVSGMLTNFLGLSHCPHATPLLAMDCLHHCRGLCSFGLTGLPLRSWGVALQCHGNGKSLDFLVPPA